MKKTLSIRIFPVWVALWEQVKFAGSLSLPFPKVSEFPWAVPLPVRWPKPQPCMPQPFFCRALFEHWEQLPKSLKVCSFDTLDLASVEEMLLDEKKKKKWEVGTFPSPTRSLMIFVLFSFNSYLKFQPFTARSARTDLCFTKDAQSPFVEDMGPTLWHLGCAALSAGTLSILLAQLCRQCFRTKIILPICLYSILYNLLRASAIQTVNDNKSMWTRLEPQILGVSVIYGSWILVCSCTFDLLHTHTVPWALAMKSKYCLFPIKNTQMVFFFPSSYFKGVIQKLKPWPYQWEWDTKVPFVISFSNTKQSHET